MSDRNNGGPAFPEAVAIGPAGDVYPGMGGMSLRDWFAGQALSGYIAHLGSQGHHASDYHNECAFEAYALADAMIVARSKP